MGKRDFDYETRSASFDLDQEPKKHMIGKLLGRSSGRE